MCVIDGVICVYSYPGVCLSVGWTQSRLACSVNRATTDNPPPLTTLPTALQHSCEHTFTHQHTHTSWRYSVVLSNHVLYFQSYCVFMWINCNFQISLFSLLYQYVHEHIVSEHENIRSTAFLQSTQTIMSPIQGLLLGHAGRSLVVSGTLSFFYFRLDS